MRGLTPSLTIMRVLTPSLTIRRPSLTRARLGRQCLWIDPHGSGLGSCWTCRSTTRDLSARVYPHSVIDLHSVVYLHSVIYLHSVVYPHSVIDLHRVICLHRVDRPSQEWFGSVDLLFNNAGVRRASPPPYTLHPTP